MSPASHHPSVPRKRAIASPVGCSRPWRSALCWPSSGCSRFRAHTETQYVYVIAKQSILRDRFAAVSNRVGEVTNGEKLEVIERGRRAIKVKTPNGVIGWIEEKAVADQALADQFEALSSNTSSLPSSPPEPPAMTPTCTSCPASIPIASIASPKASRSACSQRATVPKPTSPGAAVASAAVATASRRSPRPRPLAGLVARSRSTRRDRLDLLRPRRDQRARGHRAIRRRPTHHRRVRPRNRRRPRRPQSVNIRQETQGRRHTRTPPKRSRSPISRSTSPS